ncbi:MAG: hypothetical protein II920_03200, partial [Clostridia bacterium]|nr:hypothetical protein [Clostridia bacterium]
QQRLLTNVVLLLDWVDIHKVMDVLGGWSKDGALTRGQLARGASCLNRQIGMKNPGRKAAGWGKLSHETLIDAFVLADYYCTLRSGLDMKPLYDFRDLLGLYINATVSPEEIMSVLRPVPNSESQQPSNSTPVSTPNRAAAKAPETPQKAAALKEQAIKDWKGFINDNGKRLKQSDRLSVYWCGDGRIPHYPSFAERVIMLSEIDENRHYEFCALFKHEGQWYLHEEGI